MFTEPEANNYFSFCSGDYRDKLINSILFLCFQLVGYQRTEMHGLAHQSWGLFINYKVEVKTE